MKKINYDKKRIRVRTFNEDASLTQQQFKDDCDINLIIAKYEKTGQITHLRRSEGQYLDLSHISDYQTSLNKVMEANAMFDELPSDVRLRFGNDPQQFITFCQEHEKNYEEGVKLGLFKKRDKNVNESNEHKNSAEKKINQTPSPQSTAAPDGQQ